MPVFQSSIDHQSYCSRGHGQRSGVTERPRHFYTPRLSAPFHGLRRCAPRYRNLNSDRRSQPGTWIPPRTCRIGSVVARSDAIEITVGVLIKQWINKAHGLSNALIDERDQSSPERSHGAGASDHVRLPIDESNVAGVWVGISGHIRNASTNIVIRIGGRWHVCPTLPTGKRENVADAASGCAFVTGEFVPHGFAGNGIA